MTGLLHLGWLPLVLAAPCVGSFLALLAERLPVGRPIVWARSECAQCGHALGPRDLVPVVSWLVSRGRCRHCAARVSPFYPAVELAALTVALWSLAVLPGWLAWAGAGLGWALIALAAADLRHGVLPDEITLPLVLAGIALVWIVDPARPQDHAIGATAGFLVVLALRALYRRLRRREGIGLGDAKLMAAAGAWVGWQGLSSMLLIAAATGLGAAVAVAFAARGRGPAPQDEVSFGPFLALGLWLTWLYGPLVLG